MPMPWPTGASGPASITWPGKRAWNHCVIQPLMVKLSMTTVASRSSTSQSSRASRSGWIGDAVVGGLLALGDRALEGRARRRHLAQPGAFAQAPSSRAGAAASISWRSTSFGSPTIATSAGTCQPIRAGVASTWM